MKVIANHEKIVLKLDKDTVEDVVIFEHLYELSDGKINLLQSSEELLNTTDLMRTNKKVSNKNQVGKRTKNPKKQQFQKTKWQAICEK